MSEEEPWKVEAQRWDQEVREFGEPITPDHPHHEVRDWLNGAFLFGWRFAAESLRGAVENALTRWPGWAQDGAPKDGDPGGKARVDHEGTQGREGGAQAMSKPTTGSGGS